MHPNENKYDQLFRNRLRDLTHPVRNELWSRILSGIRVRKPSVSNPRTKLSFLRSNGLFSATSLTVAAAAVAITLCIIYFTHTATRPSAHPVNHYSTITPAIAPARSTGESSVTPRDSSRDRSNESASPANARTTPPLLKSTVPSTGLSRVPTAPGTPSVPGTIFTKPNPTPENTATAVIHRNRRPSGDHLTPGDRINTARHHHTSADPGAHHTSAAAETMPGIPVETPNMEETAATPGNQTRGKQTMEKTSVHHHNPNPVTLPAMARISTRAAISASSPTKSSHNASNTPDSWPAFGSFHRTGYISLYASPDFPNHYYTWSYTVGFRATFQFSRRWSITSGFEYARVNVPTQVVPPAAAYDTLHSFYFSNYEVPVLFGYTRTSRHAALTVYGGAIVNLYFHASTSVWINNWPDRDSYGTVLGFDYSYSLDRHLAIFAQPYARYSISDYRMFTQAQRWSFGTLLGIKYRL